MISFDYEEMAKKEGYEIVCGVDEAGRGPLAGPVFAAACILPSEFDVSEIDDSKKLSEKKREKIFEAIIHSNVIWAIGTASVEEIDEINILNATFLAMKRAIEGLSVSPSLVLVDGNRAPNTGFPERTVVKGDQLSFSIAAASILAKVSRDRYMLELDKKYPQYAFAKHKGYGTKLHYERIMEYGISEVHRKSFLKKFYAEDEKKSQSS